MGVDTGQNADKTERTNEQKAKRAVKRANQKYPENKTNLCYIEEEGGG